MLHSKAEAHRPHRKPVSDEHDRRADSEQKRLRKRQALKNRYMPVGVVNEGNGKANWDDTWRSEKGSRKARQRTEMLREERLLKRALTDTFDF